MCCGHLSDVRRAGAGTRIAPRCGAQVQVPAQLLRNLTHFASRNAMDIDGAAACCGAAAGGQRLMVSNAADIYSLRAEDGGQAGPNELLNPRRNLIRYH